MKKVRILFLAVGFFITSQAFSQASVSPATFNASGGTNFFTFYRFDWSFGEAMAIETMEASGNLKVTNGILQPGTHNPGANNTGGDWGAEEIKILPNPVQNQLEIDFMSKQKGKVTMTLFDEAGKLVSNRQFDYYGTERIEKWNFGPYPSGAYFLKIQLVPAAGSVAKNSSYRVIKVK
ncbi:MAG: T9SS type A sorting domain-containing protein [Chitinophagaceae bacterium]